MPADGKLLIVLLLVSLAAVYWGVRLLRGSRHRVGQTPHCAGCDYDLTANTSAVCPECGLALDAPSRVVRGERVYRRDVWARGFLIFVLGSVLGGTTAVQAIRTFDGYRLRPTNWLIDDVAAGPPRDVRRAWAELARRIAADGLDDPAHARLTSVAIAVVKRVHQAPPAAPRTPILQELSNYVGDRVLAGKLAAPQLDEFFAATVRPVLRVRRLVLAGDSSVVELGSSWIGPSRSGWWVATADTSVTVGDKAEFTGQGGSAFSGFGSGGHATYHVKPRPAGDYPVTVSQVFRAYSGPMAIGEQRRPIHEWTVAATGVLHVVDAEPPGTFSLIDKPELLPAMQSAVTIDRFALEDNGPNAKPRVQVRIAIRNPPENIAFDVSVRVAGREFDIGSVQLARGQNVTWHLGADPLRDLRFDKADFHFRASGKAARSTVDLFQIWNGELLIKDVPLTRETPSTRPAP